MKKSALILISLLLLSFISVVLAQTINETTGLPNDINDLTEAGKKLTDEQTRSEYLKKEWGIIFKENPAFKPFYEAYMKVSPYTNPIFKYTIGMTPSLSWLFLLTLALWITLLIYLIRIFEFTSFSPIVRNLISLIFIVMFSLLGATKAIAELIINLITKLATSWWMQLFGAVIVVVWLVLLSMFSENLKKWVQKMRENRAKMKEEIDRFKSAQNAKTIENFTKTISEA